MLNDINLKINLKIKVYLIYLFVGMLFLVCFFIFNHNYHQAQAAAGEYEVDDAGDITDDVNPGDGICADAGGNCTLRAAMQEANNDNIDSFITFDTALNGSTISPACFNIMSKITITGPGASNLTIDGVSLRFENGSDDSSVSGLKMTNCPNSGDTCISIGPDNVVVDNLIISGMNLAGGIWATANDSFTFSGHTISNNIFSTAYGTITFAGAAYGENIIISNNVFDFSGTAITGDPPASYAAILIRGLENANNTITNNQITDTVGNAAIAASGSDLVITNNTISDFGFNGSRNKAIDISTSGDNVTVTGNTIENITGSGGIGISAQPSGGVNTISNLNVSNNIIDTTPEEGILINGFTGGIDSSTFNNNTISNSPLSCDGLEYGAGLVINNSDIGSNGIEIKNNNISGSHGANIGFYHVGAYGLIDISNNILSDAVSGSPSPKPNGEGLNFNDVYGSNFTISNNTFDGNVFGIGVSSNTSPDSLAVSNNTFSNNSQNGLYLETCNSGYTVSDNTISDSGEDGVYIDSACEDPVAFSSNTLSGNGSITAGYYTATPTILTYDEQNYDYTGNLNLYYAGGGDSEFKAVGEGGNTVSIADGENNFNLALLSANGDTITITLFVREDIINDSTTMRDDCLTWTGVTDCQVDFWQEDVWLANENDDYTWDDSNFSSLGITKNITPTFIYTAQVCSYYAYNIQSIGEHTFDEEIITNSGNGFYFSGGENNAGNNTIENSSISATCYDFISDSTNNNNIKNTSFFPNRLLINSGNLDIYYDVRILVVDDEDDVTPISSATTTIKDADGNTDATLITGSNGYTSYQSLYSYRISNGNITSLNQNPYTFTATKSGSSSSESATIDSQDETVTIALLSNLSPTLISSIPDQSWDEDETSTLNLSSYFTDTNGDILTYSVITDPEHIEISIVDSNVTFTPQENWNGAEDVVFQVSDGNGGTVNSNTVTLTVNAINDSPEPPTTGFSPSDGEIINTVIPIIVWNAAVDVDDGATNIKYTIRIGEDYDVINNYDYQYTTDFNKLSYDITDDLTDDSTYYYAIKSIDDDVAESSWSIVQNFKIDLDAGAELTVLFSVGLDPSDQEQSSLPSLFKYLSLPSLAAANISENQPWLNSLIGFVSSRIINYFFLAILLISLVGSLIVVKNPAKIFKFFFKKPASAFAETTATNGNGIYHRSFSKFKIYNQASKTTLFTSIFVLVINIVLLGFLSVLLIETTTGVFAEAYVDDGKYIEPGDVLTYRVDWSNIGQVSVNNFQVSIPIPDKTSYKSYSIVVSENTKIDEDDGDAGYLSNGQINLNINKIISGQSGYGEIKVILDNPNVADTIFNQSFYTYYGQEQILTNSISNPLIKSKVIGSVKVNNQVVEDVYFHLHKDKNSDGIINEEIEPLLVVTQTDSQGSYNFLNLGSGDYIVLLYEDTDFKNLLNTVGAKAINSIANSNPRDVSLARGEEKSNIDFNYSVSIINVNQNQNQNQNINLNQSLSQNLNQSQNINLNQSLSQDIDQNGPSTIESAPNEDIVLDGTTEPGAKVIITIELENGEEIIFETIADEKGIWQILIGKDKIFVGNHIIYIQTEIDGQLSEMIELAKLIIFNENKISNTFLITIIIFVIILAVGVLTIFYLRAKKH